MTNTIRELKVDELEVVSGGSFAENFMGQAADTVSDAVAGLADLISGGISRGSVTRAAIAAAKATVAQKA